MDQQPARSYEFETERLAVGEWHAAADECGVDLAQEVTNLLTEATTQALPAAWQGPMSAQRAPSWIDERDLESPTLLVVEKRSRQAVGLLFLFEVTTDSEPGSDLRIGYLFAEHAWGQGFASELVAGLVACAGTQPAIRTVTGGVAPTNAASIRVLAKNGFEVVADSGGSDVIYRLQLPESTEWD